MVLSPLLRAAQARRQYEFDQRLTNFKMLAVKRYHPLFQKGERFADLSYDDISRRFNVDGLYDQIGH